MAEMIAYWEKPGRDQDKAAYAAPRLRPVVQGTGEIRRGLEAGREGADAQEGPPRRALCCRGDEYGHAAFSQGREYARRAIEAAPKDPEMYALMADICQFRNDQPDKTIYDQQNEALEVLEQGLKTCESKPAKAELLWRCANLDLERAQSADAKGVADAEECMRKLRDYGYPPARLAFLDARVAYAKEDWKSAREGFEKVRPQLGDTPLLLKNLDYWIGFCYLQQGNDDQAMAAFRSSLNFRQVLLQCPRPHRPGLPRQRPIQRGGRRVPAGPGRQPRQRRSLPGLRPNAPRWNWNLLRSPEEQNWDEVDRALRRAEELAPRDGQVKLLIVESLAARGQADEAADLLKSLRESSPQGIDFWIAQVNLAARRGEADQARTILDEAKARLGDQVPIRLAQARILLREQGLQAGAEIEKLAAGVDAFSPAEKAQLWEGLMDESAGNQGIRPGQATLPADCPPEAQRRHGPLPPLRAGFLVARRGRHGRLAGRTRPRAGRNRQDRRAGSAVAVLQGGAVESRGLARQAGTMGQGHGLRHASGENAAVVVVALCP